MTVSLTETEREWVQELVINVANETAERVVSRILDDHVASCPHGSKLTRYAFLGMGLAIGAGAMGSGVCQVALAILKASIQ
jgi:hypothetical protein